jgi:hypothetical protein
MTQIDRLMVKATESRPIRKNDKGGHIGANHLLKLSADDINSEVIDPASHQH